ncbi:DUF1667 domain-containing protein [Anaerosacchariphilus polymeriproducens]|uniref:DUF1667 domain-containing protein n=1 Tax=Anaerosacchariphilus polymeriproducens TaxID=1812858 RepID=A0A371AXM6_9FIRM|nr:DUF1667 domain-containing protein [Anaerosacchariphilus polymeriproducens]RDU24307.1 DUF1667 domain-containing protein [Anaerosacchariphilus polymeriproducens]
MEERKLTCIGCPLGCEIEVKLKEKQIISIIGNTCKRGELYVREEVTNPSRIVTSTVKVENGKIPMVSVKTQNTVPKGKIFECIKELKTISIKAPVKIGDIIIENSANTGISIIATKNVEVSE